MAVNWDPRITFGIINTEAVGLTCVATIKSGSRRCQQQLDSNNRDQFVSKIDTMPETAPANPATEETTLERIAPRSLCRHHNDEEQVANVMLAWQQVLTVERNRLAMIRKLQSEGIGDVNDSRDDSDSESESDDGHSLDGDHTTSTTSSVDSDRNPEPNESPETRRLREELARFTPEVEALRAQIERTTPELAELHQQLARATPETEVEDLRRQLERATLEKEQIQLESEQMRRENAQSMLDNEDLRLQTRRLQRTLDQVRRLSAGLDAEPEAEERPSEPLGARSEQSDKEAE
jgi:hypothetical protein